MALQLSYLLSLLLLVLLLPYSTTAQTSNNQSLGSSLIAQEKGSYWASPSGDFAFGFQQIGNGGYLLAIWFNKITEKTIVWSAKRDTLVPTGSKVQLTKDGKLILSDPTGTEIWNSESGNLGVVYAAMLDTGNFVLASQDGGHLWQSFDLPTDTMLPSQTMSLGRKLVAHYSERNNSNGRFQFALKTDGNLQLQTLAYPLDYWSNTAYWESRTNGSGFQVVFNESGSIYLTAKNGSILTTVSLNSVSKQDFYQRAVMEYDGVLIHYVYQKSSTSTSNAWSILSLLPKNICEIAEDIGSGACGFNSYCEPGDDGRPNCKCPTGYTFIDPNDVMKGCRQNFLPQSCDEASSETDQFDLSEMGSVNWLFGDYGRYDGVTEDWCRKACLGDCFCAMAVFGGGRCWKKKSPLSNGKKDPIEAATKVLIKIRKDNSTFNPSGADLKKKNHSIVRLILSVLLGSSMFLNLLLLAAFLLAFRFKYWKLKARNPYPVKPVMNLRSYTYEELIEATNGFKEELGRGAFAKVYKGVLEYEDRKLVAVKRLNTMEREGDMEFNAEVSAIGRTNHRNLVQLLGFCNEGEHRLLVYEFMSNGSLASFLFGGSRPYWHQRIQIALETARGLFYLHEECSTQIIHCDIKPQNILLDDSFSARISDFGLAKLLKADQTRTTTGIRGTKGYVAPEWFRNMPVTIKVDVYSFGILLLELICCRKSFEAEAKDEDQMILSNWAYDCYNNKKLDLLVENDEEAIDDMKRLEKYVMIALWCIQEDPSQRPTMKKVVQMMEGSIEVSVPPD
ncbi:G-type lectin S-receptor-like serine/threonine-protein kinase LECRK2 [Quercus lobata]|uniref:Receptor-like serine/threonine-protein kinase n=1 Tax=Quercus lobata TaxID=97700 RepID=A0A7N2KKZ4_QUELO|nr:G-type lectin S-receptor-like serine/threonine-protein kinase LECRK2 [Quercus lobata]